MNPILTCCISPSRRDKGISDTCYQPMIVHNFWLISIQKVKLVFMCSLIKCLWHCSVTHSENLRRPLANSKVSSGFLGGVLIPPAVLSRPLLGKPEVGRTKRNTRLVASRIQSDKSLILRFLCLIFCLAALGMIMITDSMVFFTPSLKVHKSSFVNSSYPREQSTFLAALSSSRTTVVGLSVRPSTDVCEKVTWSMNR